jgi:hypothetical protein
MTLNTYIVEGCLAHECVYLSPKGYPEDIVGWMVKRIGIAFTEISNKIKPVVCC